MSQRQAILTRARTTCQLPVVAVRVLELLQDPDSDLKTIETLIRHEPVLSASVLRRANAAASGTRQPITSIGQSLVRLGYRKTSELILQLAIAPLAAPPVHGYGLRHGDLWRHAAATAIATDVLASERGLDAPIDAFTVGLLHDLGKLVLDPFVGELAPEIRERAFADARSFEDAERQVLGIDHAEVGAVLVAAWGLGDVLAECVRWHHAPEHASEPARELTELVHAAQQIVTLAGIGGGWDGLQYHCSEPALQRLALTPALTETVLCRTMDELDHLMQLNDLHTGSDAA